MKNKSTFKNHQQRIYIENYLKNVLFKYLIILLSFVSINPFLTSRNKFILFSEVNQIFLKVKGQGKIRIINPDYIYPPYIYYLNDEGIPRKFKDSDIDCPKSENKVKLIFDEKATNCSYMFKGCSNITKID